METPVDDYQVRFLFTRKLTRFNTELANAFNCNFDGHGSFIRFSELSSGRTTRWSPKDQTDDSKRDVEELMFNFVINSYLVITQKHNDASVAHLSNTDLIPAWVNYYVPNKMWHYPHFTYQFPNVDVCECKRKFHPTLYNGCSHSSMLRLKLIHVNKKCPWR